MPPRRSAVDSKGFEKFLGVNKQGSFNETPYTTSGKWPSAEEIADQLKKTGSGSADVSRTNLQFLDPAYFDPLLFFIQHRDRKELNFRLRHAYEYDPTVGNLIDLHKQMPLSDYSLSCQDPSIQRDFEEFSDRTELLTTSSYILGDYFLLGECAINKVWDDYNKTWKQISLIPPEKIELRRTYLSKQPLAMLVVDDELKRLTRSSDPVDQAIVRDLDPNLVEMIKANKRIVLNPSQFYHFANKTSMTDLRGTSFLKRALYALLLKYKVRLLHSTYMDRAAFPLKVFKLGDPQHGWVPSKAHFDALRNVLKGLANDPDGSLIWHFGLQIEFHGIKDKWEDLIKHYQWADQEIMTALFGSESLLKPGKGGSFSNSNINVRVLMSRYQTIRTYLELFWKNQIFKTMALSRGYWVPDRTGNTNLPTKNRNGKFYYLDVPRFKWAKINLLDDTAQKQFIMRLREKMEVSHKATMEMFGLDHAEMVSQLKDEEGSPVDPVWVDVRKKAASDNSVMSQVLQGKKSKEWVLPEDKKTDTKKPRTPGTIGGPGSGSPGGGGGGGGLSGGPAEKPPTDDFAGSVPPGAKAEPNSAPTGKGTPGENPPTEPGQGVTAPPV